MVVPQQANLPAHPRIILSDWRANTGCCPSPVGRHDLGAPPEPGRRLVDHRSFAEHGRRRGAAEIASVTTSEGPTLSSLLNLPPGVRWQCRTRWRTPTARARVSSSPRRRGSRFSLGPARSSGSSRQADARRACRGPFPRRQACIPGTRSSSNSMKFPNNMGLICP